MRRFRTAISVIGLLALLQPVQVNSVLGTVYYVSNGGSDDNDGVSPETPWHTISRVNAQPLAPGDVVRLKRGDCWREGITPRSGSEQGPVAYSAYGHGDKPLLLGSIEKNRREDWTDEGGNIWSTAAPSDVGNIIFDGEASCGVKVWNSSELNAQGRFWYDRSNRLLKLYSTTCPADRYTDIECALRPHMIEESGRSYIIYEQLALKYGGAHGIGGGETHHIVVRDCDFSYLGGGELPMDGRIVRFGNGVEFWGNAHDNLVERCRLWEIYDAALTNQNRGAVVRQYNLRYRCNLIWNCEYSFEYWNRPEESLTDHVYFENNTCVNAGGGWGHTQRPDPSGRHLCFYTTPAVTRDIYVRNNIFYEAHGHAFYAPRLTEKGLASLRLDHNCWYQSEGNMVLLPQQSYPMARFADYQAAIRLDAHSIVADPRLADTAKRDFHLSRTSPCIDAGTVVGLQTDFAGVPIPQGKAPEIGAYEYEPSPESHPQAGLGQQ